MLFDPEKHKDDGGTEMKHDRLGPQRLKAKRKNTSIKGGEVSEVCFSKPLLTTAQSPVFGPRGRLAKDYENFMTVCDPTTQKLHWHTAPTHVLIIRKITDDTTFPTFVHIIKYLIQVKNLSVIIQKSEFDEAKLHYEDFKEVEFKVQVFTEGEDLTQKVDFIVTLGGDGTLLYCSSLFQSTVPPIVAFHLGSMGFLSPFRVPDYPAVIDSVLAGNLSLCLRTRLKCSICRKDADVCIPVKNVESKTHTLVLNEVVVDRGAEAKMCFLDIFVERESMVTSVQADGLIISSPTGSTAYSTAAGASMIHPNIPAIVITPICARSLSIRPIIVPAGVEIMVALNERNSIPLSVSYDGRSRTHLARGDILRVSSSIYPLPSVCSQNQVHDWFNSLARCLFWNLRTEQKSFMNMNVSRTSNAKLDDHECCTTPQLLSLPEVHNNTTLAMAAKPDIGQEKTMNGEKPKHDPNQQS